MVTRSIGDGLIQAMMSIQPRFFVTLEPLPGSSVENGSRRVVEWLKRTSHAAFGKRWSRRPVEERLRAYGFPEHTSSNLHFHLVLGGPDEALLAAMEGERRWKALCPGCQFDVGRIENLDATVRYVLKNHRDPQFMQHFIAF